MPNVEQWSDVMVYFVMKTPFNVCGTVFRSVGL